MLIPRRLLSSVACVFLFAAQTSFAAETGCPENKTASGADLSLPCVLESLIAEHDAKVFFDANSHRLTALAKTRLDKQAAILRSHLELSVTLLGFSDSVEIRTASGSLTLPMKRAEAVRDYLIGKGVSPERTTANASPTPALIPREENEETLANMRFVRTSTGDQ